MTQPCRSWWRNCATEVDSEIDAIDAMEDQIAPLSLGIARVRGLISGFELCHHKAERWITNIVGAIGVGETAKGLGTRPAGQVHPAEEIWQRAWAVLSDWCAGCPSTAVAALVGTVPAKFLLSGLGERSPLKEWQVHRVMERIRSAIHWPQSRKDPDAQYVWLLFSDAGDGSLYRSECPERYRDHESFWKATVKTIIQDSDHGVDAQLSLGLAIDMLWPCHWRFVENLQIVLEAMGGKLNPEKPFAACGRNIALIPNQRRMESIADALKVFSEGSKLEATDRVLAERLGKPTPEKQWLAASLDKTIRLQLNPPAEARAVSALAGPDWIKQ